MDSGRLKRELFRFLVIFLLLGFFIFPYLGKAFNYDFLGWMGFVSLFLGVGLAIIGGKKGLNPEDVEKRSEWMNEGVRTFSPLLIRILAFFYFLIAGVAFFLGNFMTAFFMIIFGGPIFLAF